MNQKILSGIFKKLAIRHNVVHTREDGLAALSNFAYDAILIDCDTVEFDSYNLVSTIRDNEAPSGKHTPILFTSADVLEEHRIRYIQARVSALLAKPYVIADVSDTMNSVLKRTAKSA